MYNELHESIQKYLNRINTKHDLGSSEICFYPVAPEDGRFLPEISDGDASCVYSNEMDALQSVQSASYENCIEDVWFQLQVWEVKNPKDLIQNLKEAYFRILIREELEDLSNKIPEEFWDFNQQFGTSEHPVYVDSHFGVDNAIKDHPELEEEILAYQSMCLKAGTLIIKNASEALEEMKLERFVSARKAKNLIDEAFSTEMDFGDAPWTKTVHELTSKTCED
jgi:hypothetical protein